MMSSIKVKTQKVASNCFSAPKVVEVYLAIAPAPVNELLWDPEDSFPSEMSPQRDWALEDNRGRVDKHGNYSRLTLSVRKCMVACETSKDWFGRRPPTCCLHFRWQPAPRRVLCWSIAACSKRSFRCGSSPCCCVGLCRPKAQRQERHIYVAASAPWTAARASTVFNVERRN